MATPLFAFDFASPAMLGWLAAAVAPLLIHLWSRRRYRQMSWAAMEYLLAAVRNSRRRMLLEHWLLLAIRTMLVILVVIAVAEPFLERIGFGLAPGQQTLRVIVLDGSFSMDYHPTDKSRFERAKELAAEIVGESPQGDGFTLVLLSNPPRVVVGRPVFEANDFLAEIEALALPHTTADVLSTVGKVQEVLAAAAREYPRLGRREVYFLTDLGRVGWAPEAGDKLLLSELRGRLAKLADLAQIFVIDLGQDGAENLAITGLRTSESFATVGKNVNLVAEIKNFGRQSRQQTVEFLVDGRRISQQRVDLSPAAATAVSFDYRFESPGDHAIEARLSGDALEVDNRRWAAVPVQPAIRALVVDGRPSGTPLGGAADFLFYALAPQPGGPDKATVYPEKIPDGRFLEQDLSRYDCVFLANVAQFTPTEARVLDAYLGSGGSLVFFLGDRVVADRYNRELAGNEPGSLRILPARLGTIVETPQNSRHILDPLDYRHPIIEPFRGREKAGLLTTPVAKYFQLQIPAGSKAKVALAVNGGGPLIVEEPIHRGRVILVATSADVTWTSMPVWPSFVPIVQEILAFAVRGRWDQRNLRVGQPLGGSVPAMSDDGLTVKRPDGRSEQLRFTVEADWNGWSLPDTDLSGIYEVRPATPQGPAQLFAVNVDPQESDLARVSPEELRQEIWSNIHFGYHTSWDSVDRPPIAHFARGSPVAKTLLYAVLVLLFVETYCAWRFGHAGS